MGRSTVVQSRPVAGGTGEMFRLEGVVCQVYSSAKIALPTLFLNVLLVARKRPDVKIRPSGLS
jgi:hypothetical protein